MQAGDLEICGSSSSCAGSAGLVHSSDQEHQTDQRHQQVQEQYAQDPTRVLLPRPAKVSHRACRITATRKAPRARQFNVAYPALSLSLQRTAHTKPVYDICLAGELRRRTKSTSSSTPRLPLEASKETNP
jgi:hypothetical protein